MSKQYTKFVTLTERLFQNERNVIFIDRGYLSV